METVGSPPEKRKRGRPRKSPLPESPAQAARDAPTAAVTAAAPAATAPEAASPRPAYDATPRATRRRVDPPRLELTVDEGSVTLSSEEERATLDHRLYAGLVRDAVREFVAQAARQDSALSWAAGDSMEIGIDGPDERLLDLAAEAGMLFDREGKAIVPAEGSYALAVAVSPEGEAGYRARLRLEDDSGEPVPGSGIEAVAPRRVVQGGTLFRVADLGPDWIRLRTAETPVLRADLRSFLSLTLSRLRGLRLRYLDYVAVTGPVREARPGLLFSDLDAYGYLHARPVAVMDGYPPGFFEDFEVTMIAEPDDEERRVTVSEIVFPVDPAALFQTMLRAHGGKDQSGVILESGRFIMNPDFAAAFLPKAMGDLIGAFRLFQTERLAAYKIRVTKLRPRLSMSSGIDFLEGSATVYLDDERLSYGRFLAEYRRQGFIELSDGSRAYVEAARVDRLERLVRRQAAKDGLDGDEAVGLSFFDVAALARDEDVTADGEAWHRAVRFFRGYNDISPRDERYAVEGSELRPYQRFGAAWLDYVLSNGFGACLADEMGLGKTVQTIAVLRRAYGYATARGKGKAKSKTATLSEPALAEPALIEPALAEPALIVVPKSLLFNWATELARFAPELTVRVHYGLERGESLPEGPVVILTTYATLRIDEKAFEARRFGFVVLDESQTVKNSGTKTAAAVHRLRAERRVALSGTPIENNIAELYSLFRFLNPSFFGTQADFLRRYRVPIVEDRDEEATRDLRTRVRPFMLRRQKRDVLKDLPPKTEQVAIVELEPAHLAAYHRRREELKDAIDAMKLENPYKALFMILTAMTELRRLASVPEADAVLSEELPGVLSAKRAYLAEALPDIAASGHKCLVFTNYLATVDLVSQDLAGMGVQNLVITGATGDRGAIVRRFQTDPDIRALVMTLKTGGLGLNLTAADYVFILDPWWNAAAESQAVDRTHRIGQSNPVFCYRLIAKDTIEERMLELQRRKTDLASALVLSDAELAKRLDDDDIEFLLG